MAKIFISYASADRALVQPLVAHLQALGLDVWWDRGLHTGELFDRRIENELRSSDCVVVVWSDESIGSNWVLSEAMIGFETGKLVPVTLNDSLSIPLPFNRLQVTSLSGWHGVAEHPGLSEFTSAVQSMLAKGRPIQKDVSFSTATTRKVIAVIPLDDLSADASQRTFASRVAEALIGALNRFSTFETVSRRASFDPALQAKDIRSIARSLNADLIVSGTVAEVPGKLVVNVELSEGENGRDLAAVSFEYGSAELPDPAQVASDVARALSGDFLTLAAQDATPGANPAGLVAAGRQVLLQSTPAAFAQARTQAEHVLALDAEHGPASALLASVLVEEIVNGYAQNLDDAKTEALRLIEGALTVGIDDPVILKYAGHILACCGEHDQALKSLRRAIELNPHDDGAYGYLGWTLAPSTNAAHLQEINDLLDRLLHRTHKHPGRPYWNLHRSVAQTCAGEFAGAYESARDAIDFSPRLTLGWLHALNALGSLQRQDEAQKLLGRCPIDLAQMRPRITRILTLLSRDDTAVEARTEGLRVLGLIDD